MMKRDIAKLVLGSFGSGAAGALTARVIFAVAPPSTGKFSRVTNAIGTAVLVATIGDLVGRYIDDIIDGFAFQTDLIKVFKTPGADLGSGLSLVNPNESSEYFSQYNTQSTDVDGDDVVVHQDYDIPEGNLSNE